MTVLGIPVVPAPLFSDVVGLPSDEEFQPDILVSMPVGEFLRNHPERYGGAVFGPDTGPDGVVRDQRGTILGTTRLLLYKDRE